MSGRFLSVDPHADSYPSLTPYNYCGNNPLNFIDPTGMDSTDSKKDQKKEEKETIPLIVTQVPIEKPDIKSLVDAIFRAIFGEEKQNTANTIYTNAESGQPPSTPDAKTLLLKKLASEQQVGEQNARTIAGGESGVTFRDAQRAANTYGGDPKDWVKKSSSSYTSPDGSKIETHWVENTKTGQRVEYKTKLIK